MSPGFSPDGFSAISRVGVLSLVMLSVLEAPVSEAGCKSIPEGAGGIGSAEVVNAQSVLLVMPV